MKLYADVVKAEDRGSRTALLICTRQPIGNVIRRQGTEGLEIYIEDGRMISPAQRRKAYATLRDISEYTGYTVEAAKDLMKVEYMIQSGDDEYISLSNCTMTQAREYINTLMDFSLKNGIILTEQGLMRTDDIDRYLIQCIRYRRCCICGRPADIHHVDAIGMGRDRKNYDDSENEIMALCREHHIQYHTIGRERFTKMYKVYGIGRRAAGE